MATLTVLDDCLVRESTILLRFHTDTGSAFEIELDKGVAVLTAMQLLRADTSNVVESQPLMLRSAQHLAGPEGQRALRLVFHTGTGFDLLLDQKAAESLKGTIERVVDSFPGRTN